MPKVSSDRNLTENFHILVLKFKNFILRQVFFHKNIWFLLTAMFFSPVSGAFLFTKVHKLSMSGKYEEDRK